MRGFRDREQAGLQLAEAVAELALDGAVIVGLPRGGVVVAAPVAARLGAPLDVVVARKLGVPHQPEFGFGAIAERGVEVLNDRTVRMVGLTPAGISAVVARERRELERRAEVYRAGREPVELSGKPVVIIDDGIATGGTMTASIQSVRLGGAARIVVAVPVAPAEALADLEADDVVCLLVPDSFQAVGLWYRDFSQTSDRVVIETLAAAAG